MGDGPPMKTKYFLTIRTGQSSLSSASQPEKGSRSGIKHGAGFIPGIDDASASRKTVFQVHLILLAWESYLGGSKSSDRRIRRTLVRSHSWTQGRSGVREEENDLMSCERHGCRETGIPSMDPKVEAIDDL